MNPSSPAKFGVAFAAGLVVALAGVVLYVKTSGVHVQQAAVTPVVQQVKQPENLTPPKVEDLPAAVVETPKAPAPPPVQQTTQVQPAPPLGKPHSASKPVARIHYPPRSLPESSSTIQVEISQNSSTAEQMQPLPPPAMSTPPVRAVNEVQPSLPAPAPVAPPQPHVVTLQPGLNLVIRLGETLSTDHNFSGDTFRATLDRPLILDGFVIADKGSKVLGKIAGLDKAGKFDGTSNLQLSLTEINTTDGQRVRIQTAFLNRKGASPNTGQEAARVGGGAILGAIIGAVAGGGKGAAIGAGAGGAAGAGSVMLGKGRPVVIPTETQLSFQLSAPTTITERLN